ncbi:MULTISPECIES: GNAT family N-acetyltransferase [Streptomyces]|uniref:GNAT family N-acetyltransferase n=1 Tax=Streptomyces TaxID=1883 RepID=UPI001923F7F3|nr:GNAT family N-acetyltransferase [Streptomyces spororaveus]
MRTASPADAEQITRLHVEISHGELVTDAWRSTLQADLVNRLNPESNLGAFVVADGEQILSHAFGTLNTAIANPRNPTGLVGRINSVATHPDHRRRGYARQCVTSLLDWAVGKGCGRVTLYSSEAAVGLYEEVGFVMQTLENDMVWKQEDHKETTA